LLQIGGGEDAQLSELGSVQTRNFVVVARLINAQTNRRLIVAGAACLAATLLLAGAYFYAFDAVVAAAATLLSTDGVVEGGNLRALSLTLLSAAAFAALLGGLLLALAIPAWRVVIDAVVSWDPLRRLGLEVPNPPAVAVSSVALGALLIGMHLVGERLGEPIGPLFRREGPFELVTVVLELVAAFWCAVAAVRHWKNRTRIPRGAPLLYGLLATVLFVVAMEELNWGQTLLAFDTPSAWAAINHQQETSLHNLLSQPTLVIVERTFAVLFGISVLALIGLALKFPSSAFAAIAPPAALVGLGLLCAIPGAYLRLEITELLLALFFAFYSHRLYVAARRRVLAAGPPTP
jgi:hypothetical protein